MMSFSMKDIVWRSTVAPPTVVYVEKCSQEGFSWNGRGVELVIAELDAAWDQQLTDNTHMRPGGDGVCNTIFD